MILAILIIVSLDLLRGTIHMIFDLRKIKPQKRKNALDEAVDEGLRLAEATRLHHVKQALQFTDRDFVQCAEAWALSRAQALRVKVDKNEISNLVALRR